MTVSRKQLQDVLDARRIGGLEVQIVDEDDEHAARDVGLHLGRRQDETVRLRRRRGSAAGAVDPRIRPPMLLRMNTEIFCGTPSSRTMKSSAFKSGMNFPSLSWTMTEDS